MGNGGGQPMVAMDNLDDGSPALVQRQIGISGSWQFSPCGDVFGLVNRTDVNHTEVNPWSTRDGASIGGTRSTT